MPTRALVTSYEEDTKLFPDVWHKIGLVLGGLFCLVFPFVASPKWLTIGTLSSVSVVGAVGLMILTGFAGQVSLGHAAFLAVGAYTTAILADQFFLPFWLGIPAAGVMAALVGLAVGPFALRLRGLYLAIVTIGLLFLVQHTLLSMPSLTKGVSGIQVNMYLWFPVEGQKPWDNPFLQDFALGPLVLTFERKLYFIFLLIAIASTFAARNIKASNTGRSMIAVRDKDLAAAALGVNPARVKVIAFGLSSFFAGVAGAMFAYQQQFITVEPPFDLNMSVRYIAMIVLGGIGTTFGAVAGAIAYEVLAPIAEGVGELIPYVKTLSSEQRATLLFSTVVIFFLLFEPFGLFGIWMRIKRYFITWPFKY